jgi:hypothetical protein
MIGGAGANNDRVAKQGSRGQTRIAWPNKDRVVKGHCKGRVRMQEGDVPPPVRSSIL